MMQRRHSLCFAFDTPNRMARSYNSVANHHQNTSQTVSTTSSVINLQVANAVSQVYYIHTDQLNTPRLITNAANAKVWEWTHDDPFGNNVPNDDPNATGNPFEFNHRFAGQYADKETNTNYNYFRDYDAESGRYIESDPIGLSGGINTYAYANAAPTMYTDPLGLRVPILRWPTSSSVNPLNNPQFHPTMSELPDGRVDCINIVFGCPFDLPQIPKPDQPNCKVKCPNPNQCEPPLQGTPALGYPQGCVLQCGPRLENGK